MASDTKCPVYLCGNSITNTNDILQQVSGHNVDFHTLTFSGRGIGDSGVEYLLHFIEGSTDSKALCECYSCVRVLDISSNNISCYGTKALSSCLKFFIHLEELNVSNNSIQEDVACSIASTFINYAQHLRKLDVSDNFLGSEGCQAIVKALHHCVNLSELNISCNFLNDSGAIAFAEALKDCNIHKLDISSNKIGTEGACAIAAALSHCGHLEELIVSRNEFGKVGACALAKSFGHYAQSLHKLHISHNNIGSVGANAIADALNHCNHLNELICRRNSCGDDGACSIARSICHYSQHLRKFDISGNHIGSKGFKAIAEALKNCVNLEELDLSCNNYVKHDDSALLINALLSHCPSLKLDTIKMGEGFKLLMKSKQ